MVACMYMYMGLFVVWWTQTNALSLVLAPWSTLSFKYTMERKWTIDQIQLVIESDKVAVREACWDGVR